MAKKRDISEARRTLAHLRDQLEPVLEVLLASAPMLKAYLDSKPRSCGKPGCHCASGEKHAAWVLRIPEGSRTRSKSISEPTFRRLEPLTHQYRRFRQAAAQWRRLVREVESAIGKIEAGRLINLEEELRKDLEK
jgi:hypothetical protein